MSDIKQLKVWRSASLPNNYVGNALRDVIDYLVDSSSDVKAECDKAQTELFVANEVLERVRLSNMAGREEAESVLKKAEAEGDKARRMFNEAVDERDKALADVEKLKVINHTQSQAKFKAVDEHNKLKTLHAYAVKYAKEEIEGLKADVEKLKGINAVQHRQELKVIDERDTLQSEQDYLVAYVKQLKAEIKRLDELGRELPKGPAYARDQLRKLRAEAKTPSFALEQPERIPCEVVAKGTTAWACLKLVQGCKVRITCWKDGKYMEQDVANGGFSTNTEVMSQETFNRIMATPGLKWELYTGE